jgi:hypothetical protein
MPASVLSLAELVEGPIERPFHTPLVAGKLPEGIPFFGVGVDRASEEYLVAISLVTSLLEPLPRFRMRGFVCDVGRELPPVCHALLVGADLYCKPVRLEPVHPRMEQRGLRPFKALEPPHVVDHMIYEKFLDRPHRREVCPNLVPEVLESVRVLSWEDDVTGKKPVPDRVEADDGFPLPRLWPRGMASVCLVCGLLSFARHGSRLPLISSHWTGPADPLSKSVIVNTQKQPPPSTLRSFGTFELFA